MRRVLFVEWRPHNRRAENLASDIGAALHLAPSILRRKFLAPLRYIFLTVWMSLLLLRARPELLIVTSPPPFPAILAYIYSRTFRKNYIVDAHHLAATGPWYRIPFGRWFTRYIMNNSLITIVHNERIERIMHSEGIATLTVETKIPPLALSGTEPPTVRPSGVINNFSILVPCSFDPDEPIAQIYETAASLMDVRFYLTGDTSRLATSLLTSAPETIVFTGFLPQRAYDGLLLSVDAVMALTDSNYPVRPRAVTEALAAGKPLLVTRNEATQDHLSHGALLMDNTPLAMRHAIETLRKNYREYQEKIKEVRKTRTRAYERQLNRLRQLLCSDPS